MAVQVAQTVVVEGCGAVLLVTRVGRDQEEGAIVETTVHVLGRTVWSAWRSESILVTHVPLTSAFLKGLLARHGCPRIRQV